MAIDDPIDIELKQVRRDIDNGPDLPLLATKLGVSAAAAAALNAHPFVSQIITSLLTTSPRRFEERLVSVMEALAKQLRQIEKKIADRSYYTTEEFHTLLALVLERLHSTHQQEKLKTFGEALANSGTEEFVADDKEPYIRVLRDLSLVDLQTLRGIEQVNGHGAHKSVPKSDNPSLARLTSFGLLQESTALRDFDLRIPVMPMSSQTPENYARGLADAFKKYFKNAPSTTFRISGFGYKFLSFIASASPKEQRPESTTTCQVSDSPNFR